jgi:uncharacterized membrane protein
MKITAPASPLGLAIGGVMAAIGVYLAVRLFVLRAPPVTGTFGLDVAFAVFFVLRGALQYRRWRLAQDREPPG